MGTAVDGDAVWVGIQGPFTIHTQATGLIVAGRAIDCEDFEDFIPTLPAAGSATVANVHFASAPTDAIIAASTIMLMNGRRYKVRETVADAFGTGVSKIVLTESYSGHAFMQMCTDCVTEVANVPPVSTITINPASGTFDL